MPPGACHGGPPGPRAQSRLASQRFRSAHASGDLPDTVGFEHGPASVDGFPEQEMVIRVTHIYRRFGAEWKLVHRHADFPPPTSAEAERE